MNRKNRVCSAALSAVLTLTLVTAPAQALGTAGAERTEGDYAVMQAVSGPSIGEIDSSGIIYNGKAQTPTPKITVGGTELVAGTDFRMEYSNNVHAGTGIAYILGMGKYAGYVDSCEFTIHPAQLVVKVDDVQDVKDPASYTYTILQGTLASGDSLGQPQYSVKDNGNRTKTVSATFQDNADYEITVLPGTLTIVQTLGTVVISGPSNVFYNGSAQTPKPRQLPSRCASATCVAASEIPTRPSAMTSPAAASPPATASVRLVIPSIPRRATLMARTLASVRNSP